MLEEPRYLSIEQALIITDVYKAHEGDRPRASAPSPSPRRCAGSRSTSTRTSSSSATAPPAFAAASSSPRPASAGSTASSTRWRRGPRTSSTSTRRTPPPSASGSSRTGRARPSRTPSGRGRPLRDAIARVVKINQKDHAQGHICPDTAKWIRLGPAGIRAEAAARAASAAPDQRDFYDSVLIVLDASIDFMRRYADLATDMAADRRDARARRQPARDRPDLQQAERRRRRDLPRGGPVPLVPLRLLHMESNASSFSPGRADQYLFPYYRAGHRRRDAGPRRCAGDHRGPLAQVQPDRVPAELHSASTSRDSPSASTSPSAAWTTRVRTPPTSFPSSSSARRRISACRSPTSPRASRKSPRKSSASAQG